MSGVYEITGIAVAIAGIAISTWLTIRPQEIVFKLIRWNSPVHEPIESKVALEVYHPDKPIKKCRIIYKGKKLVCDETSQNWATVFAQGSALFRIPLGFEDERANVIVKNGWHRLQKTKLQTIEQRYRHPPKVA